jgi:hypothetical protein
MLSKVVLSEPGSRRGSPPASIMATPMDEKANLRFHDSSGGVQNGETSPQWEEVLRYWHGNQQRGTFVLLQTNKDFFNR